MILKNDTHREAHLQLYLYHDSSKLAFITHCILVTATMPLPFALTTVALNTLLEGGTFGLLLEQNMINVTSYDFCNATIQHEHCV